MAGSENGGEWTKRNEERERERDVGTRWLRLNDQSTALVCGLQFLSNKEKTKTKKTKTTKIFNGKNTDKW